MRKTSMRWTRRQFLVAASASAAALLDACARPSPTPDATRQPALEATSHNSVYLPNVRRDAAPTPTPRRTFPTFDRPSRLGIAVQRFRDPQIMDRILADGHPRVVGQNLGRLGRFLPGPAGGQTACGCAGAARI